jgi:hypothetical protein
MRGRGAVRGAAMHGVLAAVLLVSAAGASAPATRLLPLDERPARGFVDRDLVASAHPTAGRPAASDAALDVALLRGRSVQADAVATGTATCTGCTAQGTALQVLHVGRGRRAGLHNTATAWTQECRDCAATTLSVQVALLRGVRRVVATNRALALTAACESCRATTAAYQLVVAVPPGTRLPRRSVAALRSWARERLAMLRAPHAPARTGVDPLRREAVAGLRQLEGLVTSAVPGRTVSADVDLGE